MRGGVKANGYTIVEVLIFLAISSALLISALLLVGGQQGKTQFSQGIQDLQTQIESIINDISTGYYTQNVEFDCSAPNGGNQPSITAPGAVSSSLGTNAGCIFLGRALQFNPDGDNRKARVFTVVGRQYVAEILSPVVTSYTEAKPVALFTSDVDGTEDLFLQNGLIVQSVILDPEGLNQAIGAIGFFASLDQYSNNSASQSTKLVALSASTLGMTSQQTASQIADTTNYVEDLPIQLCMPSGSSNQHAIILIGSNQGRLTADVQIRNGGCT